MAELLFQRSDDVERIGAVGVGCGFLVFGLRVECEELSTLCVVLVVELKAFHSLLLMLMKPGT